MLRERRDRVEPGAAPHPERTAPRPATLSPAGVLALQRSLGNQGVGRLIARAAPARRPRRRRCARAGPARRDPGRRSERHLPGGPPGDRAPAGRHRHRPDLRRRRGDPLVGGARQSGQLLALDALGADLGARHRGQHAGRDHPRARPREADPRLVAGLERAGPGHARSVGDLHGADERTQRACTARRSSRPTPPGSTSCPSSRAPSARRRCNSCSSRS